MRMKKDGIKILPKVGFHLWQYHFLRWNSRRLRGLEDSAKDLRGCKGGLPVLAEKPNKAFFGQRWAFPCLTVFKTARRLNLSLYGAKVGFFLSDCLKRLIRWASSLRRWAFPEVRPKVGFSSIFGQRWAYSAGSDPLQPRRYSGLPEVGFHLPKVGFSFDGAKILPEVGLIQPYKPLFGQRWASIFQDYQRWAYSAGSDPLQPRRYSGLPEVGFHLPELAELPEVGFSCCLYTL